MSVTTADDPVAVVLDIIDNTTDSDWTRQSKPNAERQEASEQRVKAQRSADYVYCYSPAEGTISQIGVDGDDADHVDFYEESQTVRADFWILKDGGTTNPESVAYDYVMDFREVLQTYWEDNRAKTNWRMVRVESQDDLRQESQPNTADHYRIVVLVRLERLVDT